MEKNEVYERLNAVFQDVFDDETITVNENTTSADVEEWDSLAHIDLVLAVETEFGMKFTIGEATSMKDVGEMVDIILSRATK